MTATPFQTRSTSSGDRFENECVDLLASAGATIVDRKAVHPHALVEIDITVAYNHKTILIECKGGEQNRPGAQRTDNVLKAIGSGAILKAAGVTDQYLVLFSSAPHEGRRPETWLRLAKTTGTLDDWLALNRDGSAVSSLRRALDRLTR